MLGVLPLGFSFARARAGSVCITAVALWAAVACGSDDDSSGSTAGAGGNQASGGSGSSVGGSFAGGGGDTSTDGGGGSGDFSAIWQAESTELMFFDAEDPGNFVSRTIDMPTRVEVPGDDREAEFYVQFEGDHRITYAHTKGDSVYYRFLTPATPSGDEYYTVIAEHGLHSYYFEDGRLVEGAQHAFGSTLSAITTTTYKQVEQFPPKDWPKKVVTYEVRGAQ